jgi:hypothetical protein
MKNLWTLILCLLFVLALTRAWGCGWEHPASATPPDPPPQDEPGTDIDFYGWLPQPIPCPEPEDEE